MSTLSRFRKPGGFQQLLLLIETCDPSKQKNLMQLVCKEDPGWAHLLKVKALTFERVLSWPSEVLMEITPPLSDLVLATVYQIAQNLQRDPLLAEKWLKGLPSLKAKEIQSLSQNQIFTPAEQSVAVIKVIQTVRELESKGILRFANFDPLLEIDQRLTAA
jgi:hypothetical protein